MVISRVTGADERGFSFMQHIPRLITGPDAFETAKRNARYGHKDWICWRSKDGQQCAAPKSYASIKAAMLANGTQKKMSMYQGSNGVGWLYSWNVAARMLRWEKLGLTTR